MAAVAKDGMKLYAKVGTIGGGESQRLQGNLEDFVWHTWDLYFCRQSLDINFSTST